MSLVEAPAPTTDQIDAAYHAQRARIGAAVTASAAGMFAALQTDPVAAIRRIVPLVQTGQQHTVALVDAYMAAKSREATGAGQVIGLDPLKYTTTKLRGIPAHQVYVRPFSVLHKAQRDQMPPADAATSAQAQLEKLVRTDLQLSQTHSARDWMSSDERIVGWRRVLTGPTSCALCTAASTRTYRTGDLMPIHEHCDCAVAPLWGTEAVSSIGTTVRVEDDPELGPRLMADSWTSVGPRIL